MGIKMHIEIPLFILYTLFGVSAFLVVFIILGLAYIGWNLVKILRRN